MLQKVTKEVILLFALSCVLSLGIGVVLGYGVQAHGLMGTAAGTDIADNDKMLGGLGASRPNYFGSDYFTCVSCGQETSCSDPPPGIDPICPLCGAASPKK